MATNQPLLKNGRPNTDDEKITRVKGQINDTQRVMQDNIHHAIQRGQNLNELDDKTLMLENQSIRFKERSTQVKRNMCFNRYRQIAIVVLAVLALVGVIALIIYLSTKK
jgi:hypothetical protein